MKRASFNSAKWCPRSLASHSYLLPWQKYIVIASSSWAHCKAVTSRKEKTQLPPGSADQITHGQPHTSCCPAHTSRRATAPWCVILVSTKYLVPGAEMPSAPLHSIHTHHSFAEGSSSAAAATTFNTDKGVQAIKKCLSCPSEGAKKENKNYLPVKEHMDPELRSLSHHRALWRVYVAYEDLQQP